MIDENAFGVLISYFDIEDDEYKEDDTERFVERFTLFERAVLQYLEQSPLGKELVVRSLGHALYLEWADGDELMSPLKWSKALRSHLTEHDFRSVCALTHGGRWLSEEPLTPSSVAGAAHAPVMLPSEPFRRALFVDTASHGAPAEDTAWGPGFYVDTEAIEALKLTPKNKPTTLTVAGADFYRLGT